MAVTKIKATDPAKKKPQITNEPTRQTKEVKTKQPAERSAKSAKTDKKPFILFRPFIGLGRYFKNSWGELRQVHWPTRKYTWQMTIAMLIYCAIFFAFIVLLDALFSLIFNNLLGGN